jgi:hypothetical protein
MPQATKKKPKSQNPLPKTADVFFKLHSRYAPKIIKILTKTQLYGNIHQHSEEPNETSIRSVYIAQRAYQFKSATH